MAILRAALISVGLALFVRTFLIEPLVVRSGSMEPTLQVGDHILINRFVFDAGERSRRHEPGGRLLPRRLPRRGEVVALRDPHDARRRLIKRCVAVGGDRVKPPAGSSQVLSPRQVYLMGDRRADSRDSRVWGPVDATLLRGRPLLVYWSTPPKARGIARARSGTRTSDATAPDSPSPAKRSSTIESPFVERLAATRWERVGLVIR